MSMCLLLSAHDTCFRNYADAESFDSFSVLTRHVFVQLPSSNTTLALGGIQLSAQTHYYLIDEAHQTPSACNSITVSNGGSDGYAPYVYPRRFSSIVNRCFPSGYPLRNAAFSTILGAYGYQDRHVYYSPGICPSGWTKNTVGTTGDETTAFCCQPGFHSQTSPAVNPPGGISTLCTSSIDSTVITTVAYTGEGAVDGSTQTFTFTGNNIPAGAIWIRYKDSDFAVSATTTASSSTASSSSKPSSTSSSKTSTSTSASSASTLTPESSFRKQTLTTALTETGSPSTTSSPGPSPSNGLSTGAKIGLGVGVSFAAIFVLSILAFILFRKRKHRRLLGVAGNDGGSSGPERKAPAELLGGGVRPTSELPAGDVGDKTVGRSELNGNGAARGGHGGGPHELGTSERMPQSSALIVS
ncbi:hypothetical protein DL98DRAFT_592560 [Cadophora sp. DSE1049]|nr:hypothetical protein DL98DRAFT_592560 [Cadophora sp. DSE1049]